MVTTGSKGFDALLFGLLGRENIEEGLRKARERYSEPEELSELEEIVFDSKGKFYRASNGKMVNPTIIGLQPIATPITFIRDEKVVREVKSYGHHLYPKANAYALSLGSSLFFPWYKTNR